MHYVKFFSLKTFWNYLCVPCTENDKNFDKINRKIERRQTFYTS